MTTRPLLRLPAAIPQVILTYTVLLLATPAYLRSSPESDNEAYKSWCGNCQPAFYPRNALCLRLQGGFLIWNDTIIKEPDYEFYVTQLLKETKRREVAVFPDHETKLKELAQIIARLSKLGAERVLFTPPVSDDLYRRIIKEASD